MDDPEVLGLISLTSEHSVDETVGRLTAMLAANGVKLFATIDHSGEAATVGQAMPPTKVLIFGNPKGGTPLMLAAPSAAIDLPLKLLVAQSADGSVTIRYNAAEYLRERHHFPEELMGNIAMIKNLAAKAAE